MLDNCASHGQEWAMNLTVDERLKFAEQDSLLRHRGLELTIQPDWLQKGVSTWGRGSKMEVLSLLVTEGDAQNPGRMIRTIQDAGGRRLEVVFYVPHYHASAVAKAVQQAENHHQVGAPEWAFARPDVQLVVCARYDAGDRLWIGATDAPNGALEVTVVSVLVGEKVAYRVRIERGTDHVDTDVRQDDLYTTSEAAQADGR